MYVCIYIDLDIDTVCVCVCVWRSGNECKILILVASCNMLSIDLFTRKLVSINNTTFQKNYQI